MTSATRSGSAGSATELLQIGPELRSERLVRAQEIEVSQGARERLAQRVVVERREPGRFARRAVRPLRGEQRDFGGEHDVGERELVADQEAALGCEGLIDPGEVG